MREQQSQRYFIWNGVDSRSMGVRVLAYPPPVRPKERLEYVTVPGRNGDLTVMEGPDVYDSYTRPMELRNGRGFSLEAVRKWLRGRGRMTYGCEPEYAYFVDLGAQQQYDPFVNGIWHCSLQMRTQPLKARFYDASETLTEAGTIRNAGDVTAYPIIIATPSPGAATMNVTVNGRTLTINDLSGPVRIDCDIMEVSDPARTELLTHNSGGPFPVLEPGINEIGGSGWASLMISKQERFL